MLKRLPTAGDWLTRATGGIGRLRHLWQSGLLERVRPWVDHTILDMRAEDGSTETDEFDAAHRSL